MDDEELQAMWAGILASSCMEEGKDDKNLIYTDILSKLTSIEAHIIHSLYHCALNERENLSVYRLFSLIDYTFEDFEKTKLLDERVSIKKPILVSKIREELSHLSSLGLITSGFPSYIDIYPTDCFVRDHSVPRTNDIMSYAANVGNTELGVLFYKKCCVVDN